ncbi:MAG: hypothetical protein ACI82A_000839 [Candidatus Azotimanducaceae bacterium]|jgi:hypothetical protein
MEFLSVRLTSDPRLAYLALTFSLLLYTAHIWLTEPPTVVTKSAPADQFSAERAAVLLTDLLQQNVPHPVGSSANQFVRSRIEQQLKTLDIDYRIQRTWSCRFQSNRCAQVENIIAKIAGDPEKDQIALMAHYDSVPTSVGAGDDGAAVAAMLETARALKAEAPLNYGVLLVITDGEEPGLLGAEAFFNEAPEAADIAVVLNYEGSGSQGVVRVLRTSPINDVLMDAYQAIGSPPIGNSLSNEIFKRMPNDTDFSVVTRQVTVSKVMAGIDFAFADERSHYHTPNDNIENLDLRTLQHQGNSMLPLVRTLISNDTLTPSAQPLVYTDPYGVWLQWPVQVQPWLVAIAALSWTIAVFFQELSPLRLLRSSGVSVGILIVSCTAGLAAFQLIEWQNGAMPNWPANLIGFRLSLFVIPMLTTALLLLWLQRWTDPLALLFAGWLWWLIFTAALTFYVPDAAIIFVMALLPACLLLAISARMPDAWMPDAWMPDAWMPDAWMPDWLLILPLVAAVPATLGLVLQVESSQGYKLVIAVLPPIALFLMLLAPYLLGSALKPIAVTSGVLAALGLVLSLSLPLYSELRPQPFNVHFYQDDDQQKAFVALTGQKPLPASITDKVAFEDYDQHLLPYALGKFRDWFHTPAVVLPSAKMATVTRSESESESDFDLGSGSGSTIRIQIAVPQGVSGVGIYLPTDAGLRSFSINGQHFKSRTVENRPYQVIDLVGFYTDEIELQLNTDSNEPIDAYLVSRVEQIPGVVQSLISARHPLGTPVHQGDQALSFRLITL